MGSQRDVPVGVGDLARPGAGWTRRFVALGPRLGEAVDLYKRLGYEVRLAAADSDDDVPTTPSCGNCVVTSLARTIYTRPLAVDEAPCRPAVTVPEETTPS